MTKAAPSTDASADTTTNKKKKAGASGTGAGTGNKMKDGKSKPTVCDCCRIRRIKCDGLEPCWRCITSGLKCTFSAARKRGPRGNGSAVLTLLRQRQGVNQQAEAQAHNQQQPVPSSNAPAAAAPPPPPPTTTAKPGVLTWDTFPMETIRTLIDAYFDYINPIVPIIEREQVLGYLEAAPTEERYALVASLAAVPIKRVSLGNKTPDEKLRDLLISEVLRVKGLLSFVQLQNNVNKAKVSFFLYLAFCSSEEFETAWYYLHEAVMISQIMRLDDDKSYAGISAEEDLDRRIFYWGLFVSDRGFSIHEHKPVIMHKTISLPHTVHNPNGDGSKYNEFISLIKIMAAMEDGFMDAWVDETHGATPVQGLITRIQNQLLGAISSAPAFESGIQKSNVLITQPWLLLLLWQMCRRNGTNNNALFPVYIASLASQVSSSVTMQDLLAHGPGMRKKFYDIAEALSESIVAHPQNIQSVTNVDVRGVLSRVVHMAQSLTSDSDQFKLLHTKASDALQQMEMASMDGWLYASDIINDMMEWSSQHQHQQHPHPHHQQQQQDPEQSRQKYITNDTDTSLFSGYSSGWTSGNATGSTTPVDLQPSTGFSTSTSSSTFGSAATTPLQDTQPRGPVGVGVGVGEPTMTTFQVDNYKPGAVPQSSPSATLQTSSFGMFAPPSPPHDNDPMWT